MASSKSDSRSPRIGLQLAIRLYLDDNDPLQLTTRNISNSGLFIDWESPLDIKEGQEMYVELAEALGEGEPEKVRTVVIRIESEGFALKYTK